MRLPKLCHHKPSGRAFVKQAGKFHYLGAWGSDEARRKYQEICDDLLRQGKRETITHLTVDQLRLAFQAYCDGYYVFPSGRQTGEADNIRDAIRYLDAWQDEPAAGFGPRKLKAVRDDMIDAGITRKSINKRMKRIVMMFAWAVSEEMLPAATHQALTTVAALRHGRSKAIESDPVQPVPEDDYQAALPEMTPPVAAQCRLMYLTGMRVSECRLMAWEQVDRSVSPWRYELSSHKTAHHGKRRVIFLGPQAQLVLRPFLADRGHVFRSSVLMNRPYTLARLGASIYRACDSAGVPRWSPGRLRHNYATHVRSQFDLDAARVALAEPDFAERVRRARANMMKRAAASLADAAQEAVQTLRQLLRADSESVRLSAARNILELACRFRDSVELESRVAALKAIDEDEQRSDCSVAAECRC